MKSEKKVNRNRYIPKGMEFVTFSGKFKWECIEENWILRFIPMSIYLENQRNKMEKYYNTDDGSIINVTLYFCENENEQYYIVTVAKFNNLVLKAGKNEEIFKDSYISLGEKYEFLEINDLRIKKIIEIIQSSDDEIKIRDKDFLNEFLENGKIISGEYPYNIIENYISRIRETYKNDISHYKNIAFDKIFEEILKGDSIGNIEEIFLQPNMSQYCELFIKNVPCNFLTSNNYDVTFKILEDVNQGEFLKDTIFNVLSNSEQKLKKGTKINLACKNSFVEFKEKLNSFSMQTCMKITTSIIITITSKEEDIVISKEYYLPRDYIIGKCIEILKKLKLIPIMSITED